MAFSTSQPKISRPPPSAVIYDLSEPYQTTITLPRGSTWTSGLHWHETHTEYLQVIQGAIQVFLEGKTQIIRPKRLAPNSGDANNTIVRIPPYARHEWQRVSFNSQSVASNDVDDTGNEDAIVIERTAPADIDKSIFFWNINGALLSAESFRKIYKSSTGSQNSLVLRATSKTRVTIVDVWLMLSLMAIFQGLDNFPVFVSIRLPSPLHKVEKRLEMAFTHLILGLARFAGGLFGIEAVREDFTPPRLWEARSSERRGFRKYD